MSKQPKRTGQLEVDVSDLDSKIEATRIEINKKLMSGENTASMREYLRELEAALEAEQKKLDDAAAAQEAAQRDAQEEERQRVAAAAQTLADARDNRVAVLATRYAIPARPIPDTRSSFHA